jgi:DNA-binding Lrp family transcriptional regulator
MEALVFVRLPGFGFDQFERVLGGEADVVAAWHVVGDVDVVVKVRCRDLTDLENLVDRMRAAGGATGTSVHLILRPATLSVHDFTDEPEGGSAAATSEPLLANTGRFARSRRRLAVGR